MIYCKKCLMPDTKPHISFDANGVCIACQTHDKKKNFQKGIDWDERKNEFENVIEWVRNQNAPLYDVVVPVSGGKDSITQVHRVLSYGLRILAVNVDYGIKTEIGRSNLDCVANMGANLIIFKPEQILQKKLIRIGFEDFGDPDLLSHTLLHAYPIRLAHNLQVPFVALGENSAFEYGGDKDIAENYSMTRKWFSKFAANNKQDAQFISDKYNIPYDVLKQFDFPDEVESSNIKTHFLSHYFYWDSKKHFKIAKKYGFEALESPAEGTFRNFVGVDEKINRWHQYLKVLKFGYGRATDHACEDIRSGRLTREEAKKLVAKHDLEKLSDSYINDFCKYLNYSKDEFISILEKYRNKNIWKKNKKGEWYIPGHLED